ncbi:37s ribosomal protein s5 [Colletotrichum higginsianum]|nr:37s ribosomal protein s5 [Colletotrichum higginsianum]
MTDILSVLTKRVVLRSVSNQTRLGKIRSASVVVVAGNGDGRLGVGEAKSTDLHIATATATLLAIRNMKPIRRYENRTIFGNVEAKISGTVVKLASRPPDI